MTRVKKTTALAPAARASGKTIRLQSREILSASLLREVLDSVLEAILILNPERQIIFANLSFLSLAGAEERDKVYGLRPGEALRCVHAVKARDGCGTTEFCVNCGAVNAIMASRQGRSEVAECRILRAPRGEALDLQVKSSPLSLGRGRYTLLAIQDISHEKRRRALEQIFFHDVLNTAMSLNLNSELMQAAPAGEVDQFQEPILRGVKRLIEEISAQKALLSAETGQLLPRFEPIDSRELLEDLLRIYQDHGRAEGLSLRIHPRSRHLLLITDRTIVFRVLDNMVRNALEASVPGEQVTLRCRKDGRGVRFSVHNPGFMPRIVQLQVFQRSFSTKGPGRGLGTYGMKLLAEKYLDGRVGFRTSKNGGTTFFLWCPSRPVPK
jgi:signal transduction histidine kinase